MANVLTFGRYCRRFKSCLIDDFLIQYCRRIRRRDFITKFEFANRGKRVYLNGIQTKDLMKRLYEFFESEVNIPRIRVGEKQTIETLINEEALQLTKLLRDERHTYQI